MKRVRLLGALVLVALVGAIAVQAFLGPSAHLSAWRDGPQDLGEFRAAVEGLGYTTAAVGVSPHVVSGLPADGRTMLLVAGVERPYRPGEVEQIVDFVERGGVLVLADDFGFANAVGDAFGVNFDKLRLWDDVYTGDANLTTVVATLDGKEYVLVLNVPTALSVRTEATVLAVTSDAAYLDADADREKDDEDIQGAFAVVAALDRGRGRAVFLSDSAPFTSAMLGQGDNRDFLLDLVAAELPDGGLVAFDESRHTRGIIAPLLAWPAEVLVVVVHEGYLRGLVLGTLLLAALAWLRLRRREEPLGHHVARLDEPAPVKAAAARKRVAAMARQRIASVHGLPPDAPPEAFREASRDEVLGLLAAGDDGLNMPEPLGTTLERIRNYGRQAPGSRENP